LTKLPFLVKKNKLLAKFWGCRGRLTGGGQTSFAGRFLGLLKLRINYKCQQSIVCLCGEVW